MKVSAAPELVRRLLIQEAGTASDPQSIIEAVERICEKLQVHLSKRVGRDGYQTLLARALVLATIPYPHLSYVYIGADGALVGLRNVSLGGKNETVSDEVQKVAVDGATTLVSSLLGLLVIFIGEDLTRRILVSIWPTLHENKASLDATDNPAGASGREEGTL